MKRPRKDAIWIEYQGERKTRDQWARDKGIKYTTLCRRLEKGWPIDRALDTPTRRSK